MIPAQSENLLFRVILVDDEEHVRLRIRSLLQDRKRIEIVAEATDGIQAVEAINRHRPDIVFLDIQMPGLNGFDVVHSFSNDTNPVVVFVTAFDEYAVKAFEVSAVDYVLKPIDKNRFSLAVDRAEQKVIEQGKRKQPTFNDKMTGQKINAIQPCRRLLVKSGSSQEVLSVKDILWIEAANKYVRLHTTDSTYILRKTMKQMEKLLGDSGFIRIHRSTIVNFETIKEIKSATHGDSEIVLQDNTKLILSRSYRTNFHSRFEADT